jgi:hypothetical protein
MAKQNNRRGTKPIDVDEFFKSVPTKLQNEKNREAVVTYLE